MTLKYEVYLLSMYKNDEGLWTENDRYRLGDLEVDAPKGEPGPKDIVKALGGFKIRELTGREISVLSTTDMRRVYAEDYYGDGSWWDVGEVKGRVPTYGLKRKDERYDKS